MNQYTGIYRRCELWFIRRELEQFGLQPLEGKIIMFLQDNQCTQEDIGAHFDLDKGRIARNLSELEEKGLVRRLINEKNKRQKFVKSYRQGKSGSGRNTPHIRQVGRDLLCGIHRGRAQAAAGLSAADC